MSDSNSHKVKITYKLQVWDMKINNEGTADLKNLITFPLHEDSIEEILKFWRQRVVIDLNLQDIYLPEYKKSGHFSKVKHMHKISIEESSHLSAGGGKVASLNQSNVENLNMTPAQVMDFVAHHYETDDNMKKRLKDHAKVRTGLLY